MPNWQEEKMKQSKGNSPKKEYEPTKNANILIYLRQGYEWTKTVLYPHKKNGFLLADVTLTKHGQAKTFVGVNAMDTPEGRKALHDIATAEEKVPVAKKTKAATATIKAKHKAALRAKSFAATNHHRGTGAGTTGQSSAEKSRLGTGVTKKDNK